ncbi:hypothetical protein Tco_1508241 [Tanacetum coccineum]
MSGYLLDSGDDSSDEDLSVTAESLHTQTASTSVVHPPSTRPLPTSLAFARRPGKEILIPLGYRAAMDRWRAAPPSTCHPLLPLEIQSSSSPPLPLLPSSSLLSPSLLPYSSHKRSKLPSPSLPPLVSPSPPAAAVPPPPPEHIKLVGDDIETLRASLASAMQEMMTLRARLRVEYAEQEVRELREFWVTDGLKISELHSRAEYAESRLKAEATKQRVKTLQVSLGAPRIDVRDLIKSCEADRFEVAKLRSRAKDIEASFWDLERHLGL